MRNLPLGLSIEHQNIWFTADQHYYHDSIRTFCNRPYNNLTQMNEMILENHNSLVGKKDIVFCVGDFSFGSMENTRKIVLAMNGVKHFIFGNHDRDDRTPYDLFKSVEHAGSVSIFDPKGSLTRDPEASEGQRKSTKQLIYLSHYAMRVWDGKIQRMWKYFPDGSMKQIMRFGAWQLYGHTHATLPNDPLIPIQVDVGVDQWNYFPVSYHQLKDYFRKELELYAENNKLPFGEVLPFQND